MKKLHLFIIILISCSYQTYAQSITTSFYAIKLLDFKNVKEIAESYGQNNVKTKNTFDYEDNLIGLSVVIYPNTKNEIIVFFDSYSSEFTHVTIKKRNSKWITPKNIKIGTTLNELIKLNGKDFKINGFETDYGGTLSSWCGGNLQNSGIMIQFEPNENSPYYLNYEKYQQVTGDFVFSSSNPIIKGLELKVTVLTIRKS